MSMKFKNKEMTDDIEYVSETYGTPDSPNPEEAEMIGHGEIVSDNDLDDQLLPQGCEFLESMCYNK